MFIHLRLHTEFSITDGTCRIEEVVDAAVSDHQTAIAITDLNNLFAAVKFYTACRKVGIKPILGSEIHVLFPGLDELSKLVFLVKNEKGYFHLSKLLTMLWTDQAGKNQPCLNWAEVVITDCP